MAQSFLVTCLGVEAENDQYSPLFFIFFGGVVTPSVIWIQNIPCGLDCRVRIFAMRLKGR